MLSIGALSLLLAIPLFSSLAPSEGPKKKSSFIAFSTSLSSLVPIYSWAFCSSRWIKKIKELVGRLQRPEGKEVENSFREHNSNLIQAKGLYNQFYPWGALFTRLISIILIFSSVLTFFYYPLVGTMFTFSGLFLITPMNTVIETFLLFLAGIILVLFPPTKLSLFKCPQELPQGNLVQEKDFLQAALNFPRKILDGQMKSIKEYALIILFTIIGASLLVSCNNLISMYLSIELQSFAVYILASLYRDNENAVGAGLKYFLLGALSSAFILLGSSFIYFCSGLLNFSELYIFLSTSLQEISGLGLGEIVTFQKDVTCILGIFLIIIGLLFKVSAAPFHYWAPDVYDGAPTIVTTWLTIMPKISLFLFLIVILKVTTHVNIAYLLIICSLLSLIIGTIVGLAQYRIKRLLAYSTISHVGFLLLAIIIVVREKEIAGLTAFLFYIIQYSITNLDTFAILLAFGYLFGNSSSEKRLGFHKDIINISSLKGVFNKNPVLGLSFSFCLFSMAGIPPLIGFFGKYFILSAAMMKGYYLLSIIGILASVISAAYYLRIIKVIHFAPTAPSAPSAPSAPRRGARGAGRAGRAGKENKDMKNIWIAGREKRPNKYTEISNRVPISTSHSYIISVLTLLVLLFLWNPLLILNSIELIAYTFMYF